MNIHEQALKIKMETSSLVIRFVQQHINIFMVCWCVSKKHLSALQQLNTSGGTSGGEKCHERVRLVLDQSPGRELD